MNVADAVAARFSARAFLPRVPEEAVVRRILERALRAPSGGNLQPWRVHALTGEPLRALLADVAQGRIETPEYRVYPENLWEPFRTRRFDNGEALYAAIGAERADKLRRGAQFAKNFKLFGAPVGLFFSLDRRVGPPQWSDMGMFMQTIMLLAVEEGLDTCPQEAWSRFPQTLRRHLGLTDEEMIFAGMALGYGDPTHPINQWRTSRADFAEVAVLSGF